MPLSWPTSCVPARRQSTLRALGVPGPFERRKAASDSLGAWTSSQCGWVVTVLQCEPLIAPSASTQPRRPTSSSRRYW
jgi:hypothetical protein